MNDITIIFEGLPVERNNVEGMVEEEGLVDWINDCNLQSWSDNLKEIGSTSRGFHSPRDCLLQVG